MSGCQLSEGQVRYERIHYFVLFINVFLMHIICMCTCYKLQFFAFHPAELKLAFWTDCNNTKKLSVDWE